MTEETGLETRLAVYGTLAPGRVNAHELAHLSGRWRPGVVRGRLLEEGWGAAHGCPGVTLDPAGDPVPVHLLTSPDLPAEWPRLDAFEGPGYRRVTAPIETEDGVVLASIYELDPAARAGD